MSHPLKPATLRLAGAALALLASSLPSQAALVWQEYASLVGALDGNYVLQVNGPVVDVVFTNQVITNSGAAGGHVGMYFAWSWVRPDGGGAAYQAMSWDNATQRFTHAAASMEVTYTGHAAEFLRIGDVLDDTWAGVAWSPNVGLYAPIASQADWEVPLFDFGWIDAGQSKLYDLRYRFVFNDAASAQDFADEGGFASYAQGVITTVPEPTGLALAGLALAALAGAPSRRRRTALRSEPDRQGAAKRRNT